MSVKDLLQKSQFISKTQNNGYFFASETSLDELRSPWASSSDDTSRLWRYEMEQKVNDLTIALAEQTQKVDQKIAHVVENFAKRTIIPIQNLRSPKLQLIRPMYAVLEYDADVYVVSCDDLNLYGYGKIEQEAIKDFCKEIEYWYFDLKKSHTKLGKTMKNAWLYLREIIKEK